MGLEADLSDIGIGGGHRSAKLNYEPPKRSSPPVANWPSFAVGRGAGSFGRRICAGMLDMAAEFETHR